MYGRDRVRPIHKIRFSTTAFCMFIFPVQNLFFSRFSPNLEYLYSEEKPEFVLKWNSKIRINHSISLFSKTDREVFVHTCTVSYHNCWSIVRYILLKFLTTQRSISMDKDLPLLHKTSTTKTKLPKRTRAAMIERKYNCHVTKGNSHTFALISWYPDSLRCFCGSLARIEGGEAN